MADLGGRVVASLESRRASELADLIRRHGGQPLTAPCLTEIHDPADPELQANLQRLCRGEADLLIALTGVGMATLFAAAALAGQDSALRAALASLYVVVRGPKPAAVLRQQGVRIDLHAPPPHTSEAVLDALAERPLAGQRVAVQLHGGAADELLAGLRTRGASAWTFRPYRWALPADGAAIETLVRQLASGGVDALLATSAAQVDSFFAVARGLGLESAVRTALTTIPVGAQGPVCAAAFQRHGVAVSFLPATGHMGALVVGLAGHLAEASHLPLATAPLAAAALQET